MFEILELKAVACSRTLELMSSIASQMKHLGVLEITLALTLGT